MLSTNVFNCISFGSVQELTQTLTFCPSGPGTLSVLPLTVRERAFSWPQHVWFRLIVIRKNAFKAENFTAETVRRELIMLIVMRYIYIYLKTSEQRKTLVHQEMIVVRFVWVDLCFYIYFSIERRCRARASSYRTGEYFRSRRRKWNLSYGRRH